MNNNSNNAKHSKPENVHIPRYIKNQPWYYKDANVAEISKSNKDHDDDYLIHHRQLKKGGALDIDNNSEPKLGLGIRDEFEMIPMLKTRRTEGIKCTNCGSSGHIKRDCLEKGRKIPKIEQEADSVISVRKGSSDSADWDARKDRWFGYTGKEYDEFLKKWEKTRKEVKNSLPQEEDLLWDTDEEVELMKLGLYKDTSGVLKQDDLTNSKLQRASVRLREDRAAYLNDVNSDEIKYDPKSRLYKSETLGSVDEDSKMFRRHLTGEAQELDKLNKFTREHAKKMGIRDEIESDSKVRHVLIANPTKYEQMLKADERMESQKPKVTQITELKAKRISGTTQSEKAKRDLKDLYG